MAASPDGEECLWVTPNLLTAVLRSTATWQIFHDFGTRKYYRFEWLKGGREFLAVALDGQTSIWDRETMQPVVELLPAETEEYITGHHPGTTTVSDDGRFAALAKSDGRVFVWDVETRALLHTYQYPEGIPSFIRISPNSDLIAVGGESFRVRIWERETGALVSRATGHEGLVMGAVFSADQSRLLTWSRDDRVRLFETATGRELVTVAVFTDGETVVGAAFSRDETEIYAMSSRLNLYAYPIMPNLSPMTTGKTFEAIATEFEALKRSINRGVLVTPEQLDWKGPPEKMVGTPQ
jgi:WD40 repeat protein